MPQSIQTPTRRLLALLAAALLALTSGGAFANPEPAGNAATLEPLEVHAQTSRAILDRLRSSHFVRRELDDAMSSHVFDRYLETLDPARSYFLASDIAEFERWRTGLDDAYKAGDLAPAFTIFNRYQVRLRERLEFLIARIDAGLETLDLGRDEWLEEDREDAPWMATPAELDDLWRKRLKATVLNMRLNGKELDEIRTTLAKRYASRLGRVDQTKSEDAFGVYMNALVGAFDPHTQYFSPRTSENFNINMSLSLEGIGAVLRTDDDYTEILRLVTAGPADKSGQVQPNDRITGVGQGTDGPMIDVVGWRLDDVVDLIRGPKGSSVRLEILRGDDEARVVSIVRDRVKLEEQSARSRVIHVPDGATTRTIGVIEVPTFYLDFKAMNSAEPDYRSTTRDVQRLIRELRAEGAEGLVIDLRNNGGGSLAEANSLTGLFIPSGPTVQIKGANQKINVISDSDSSVEWDGPLAVLVNRLSASASEIFAGAIQDYGRGVIIGSTTFGKGTVQTLLPLDRGQLKLTQAKFYRVSGQSTQHQGVVPDIAYPEIYDPESIGESTLDDALPWDVIHSVPIRRAEQIASLRDTLRARHDERVADDPDFGYLRDLAAHNAKLRARTRISLNEATRRAEKAEDDRWRLELENRLRKAHGMEPLASLDDLDESNHPVLGSGDAAVHAASADADPDADPANDGETLPGFETEPSPEGDAMVRESAHVIVDYIKLTSQVADAGKAA